MTNFDEGFGFFGSMSLSFEEFRDAEFWLCVEALSEVLTYRSDGIRFRFSFNVMLRSAALVTLPDLFDLLRCPEMRF